MPEPALLAMHVHRALLYIERLDLVKVAPTASQVEAFARSEGPSGAQFESVLTSIARSVAPLQYKVADAEPVVDYLVRLGWVVVSGEGEAAKLQLTELGRALLIGLRLESPGELRDRDNAAAVVLDPTNPIVYLELTRAVSEAGAGLLADPYFKADMLEWLINATPVTRLLVHAEKGELSKIELALDALGALPGPTRLEVRASADERFHDRFLLHADGAIRLLGTSVTGVGRHFTTITPLPAAATASLKKQVDGLWDHALTVTPKPLRRPSTP